MPFADYKDFADCVAKNKDRKDPAAYCAVIQKDAEGGAPFGGKKAPPFKGGGDVKGDEGGWPTPKLEKTDKRVGYKEGTDSLCRSCRFYMAPEGCRMVEGTIKPGYTCSLFDERQVVFSEKRPVRAFLTKLRDLLKDKVAPDDFKSAVKTARAYAGGKTSPKKPEEDAQAAIELEDPSTDPAPEAYAEWTTAHINDLPDSSFLYIRPGGTKDDGGKTQPRAFRMFPYKDSAGKTDLPHLRNAIARIPVSKAPDKDKLQARARKLLEGTKASEQLPEWLDEEPFIFFAGQTRDPKGRFSSGGGMRGGGGKAPTEDPAMGGLTSKDMDDLDDLADEDAGAAWESVVGSVDKESKLGKAVVSADRDVASGAMDDYNAYNMASKTVRGQDGGFFKSKGTKPTTRLKKKPVSEPKPRAKPAPGSLLDRAHTQWLRKGGSKTNPLSMSPSELSSFVKKTGIKASEVIVDGHDLFSSGDEATHRLFIEIFADVGEGDLPDWIPYLPRPGTYRHTRYGAIDITRGRNSRFVANMNDGVYQSRIPLDAEHETKISGALAWATELRQNEDGSADAKVEWTDRGRTMLSEKRFRFLSPEWFNKWTDPATGEEYTDIAIGGAFTTRPFFKEGSLRALVACEQGLYSPSGAFFSRGEDNMGDNGKDKDGKVKVIEPQSFEELVKDNRNLSEKVTVQDAELVKANEKIGVLETDSRAKRFTDIVKGHTEAGGPHQWFGEPEKHVSFMEKVAVSFGEDSDEFKQYVEQQKAVAAQLQTSELLKVHGSDQGDKGGSDFMNLVAAKMKEKPDLAEPDAIEQVANEKPEAYEKYNEETTQRV